MFYVVMLVTSFQEQYRLGTQLRRIPRALELPMAW